MWGEANRTLTNPPYAVQVEDVGKDDRTLTYPP